MRYISWAIFFIIIGLSACTSEIYYAPVTEVSTIEPLPKNGTYRVQPDDTLYSIAWRYGLDYRYLANVNHIAHPYHIEAGQIIHLRGTRAYAAPTRLESPVIVQQSEPVITHPTRVPVIHQRVQPEPVAPVSYWHWPARGPVIEEYSDLNKGINISGQIGDPIYAAAPGKVVYCGNGLRAYGNLIIIKHNSVFLSAYAHNSKVLVKEGLWVKSGQKIAEMGNTGSRRIALHFEIRRGGKPVNPLSYLPRR